MLFTHTLDGWDSWSRVFCSTEAFTALAGHIFKQHGLPFPGLSPLTPGTNAVFRAGEYVIKLLAPAETGVIPDHSEIAGMRHAASAGVEAPALAATGCVRDRYDFHYMIMAHRPEPEAGNLLPDMPGPEKTAFARRLRDMTARLNVPVPAGTLPDNVVENVMENRRWDRFPSGLRRQVMALAEAWDKSDAVFVHGDLTGENVLLTPDGAPLLIDFGDCHLAPPCYEWPPLAFELFRCDPVLMEAYFGDTASADFAAVMTRAVALHDFGGDFAAHMCSALEVPEASITDLDALRELIRQRLAAGIPGKIP